MSIKDIAEKLNVSKSTVSLVINGKAEQGRISEALAKRILDYVEEIGYRPNALARSLATGKSKTIGLIVENIGDSFFGPIALYIEEYLREHNYHVLYSSTLGDEKLANNILQNMLDKHVDGIIMAPTSGQKKKVQELLSSHRPLVLFDRQIPPLCTNYVGTDNYHSSKTAVKYLFDQGYKSISMITTDSTQIQMIDRLKGYQEIVADHNTKESILRISFNLNEMQRMELIQNYLEEHTLDALYFSTNYLCVSALKVLKRDSSIKNYGLLSFDDHEIFELNTPSITCIRQPIKEIAHQIVSILLSQIEQKDMEYTQVIIPSDLIIRQSTSV